MRGVLPLERRIGAEREGDRERGRERRRQEK